MTEPGNYPRGVDTRDPFPRRTATPVGLMPWIAEVGKTLPGLLRSYLPSPPIDPRTRERVILAAFNLIPIPPLDGSAVIERLLPREWWPRYLQFRQYSFGILLLLVLLWRDGLTKFFVWVFHVWAHLL